jgi:hypothetical protein
MPFLSSSPAKRDTLTVFHGTLTSLLRSAGETAQFPQEVSLAVTLDADKYRTILKNPLLETAIIEHVGKKMVADVAPRLVRAYRENGTLSTSAAPLQNAMSLAAGWVDEVYSRQAPIFALWRKSKRDQGKAFAKQLMAVGSASAGLAASVPTFGAASIPAVIALWLSISDLVGSLQGAWRNVVEAEAAVLAEARAIDQYYTSQVSSLDRLPPAPGIKRAVAIDASTFPAQTTPSPSGGMADLQPHGWNKIAAFGKNAIGTIATGLGAAPALSAAGVTAGPSVARFDIAMSRYEQKLAHLVVEANSLARLLMETLVQNEQLAHSGALGDNAKLAAAEARVEQIIGSEIGGGIARARQGFRGKISILWLVAYAERGRELAVAVRTDMAWRVENTGLNLLRGSEATIALAVKIARWSIKHEDALGSGSLVKFGQDMKIIGANGSLKVTGLAGPAATLAEWGGGCRDIVKAFQKDASKLQDSELTEELKTTFIKEAQAQGGLMGASSELREKIKAAMELH